jgi:hypothetical protein
MRNTQLLSNVGTQESRGRRWVRRMGDAAVRQPFVPRLYVAMAILASVTGFLWGGGLEDVLVAVLAGGYGLIAWLIAAILWYERKNFYEIILEQEQRIAELERGLQPTS